MDIPEPKAIVLYTADPHESAMPVLRLLGPARQAGIQVLFGNQGADIHSEKVAEADIVVIQRDFPRFAEAYADIILESQKQQKPVVYETDDLLLAIPREHFSRKDISDVLLPTLWAIADADLVTTSTAFLRDHLLPFNPNVQVLPNLLDDQIWRLREVSSTTRSDDSVCIGYMGGKSHLPDLVSVQAALQATLTVYQDRVRLKFWGVRPPEELLQLPAVEWVPLDMLDYSEFARYFSHQACDIFIAPLEDNLFNRAKSAIKFLEYSALGVPGVFSPIPAYTDVISDGQNGFLAHDLQGWQNALSRLIDNPELRREMGIAAQKTVKEDWLLSQHAGQWLEVYRKAIQLERSPDTRRTERAHAVARAANLTQARHHELELEIQHLHREMEGHTALLNEIYHSRSWQLLQKLHRLRHRLVPPRSGRERFLQRLGLVSSRPEQTSQE